MSVYRQYYRYHSQAHLPLHHIGDTSDDDKYTRLSPDVEIAGRMRLLGLKNIVGEEVNLPLTANVEHTLIPPIVPQGWFNAGKPSTCTRARAKHFLASATACPLGIAEDIASPVHFSIYRYIFLSLPRISTCIVF